MVARSVSDNKAKRDKESLKLQLMSGVPAAKDSTHQQKQALSKPAPEAPVAEDESKTSRSAKQKSKNKERRDFSDLGRGSRGIDTLLRNAYRSQLDMLALAATKANIMISLNGLMMSMLIISSTHLITVNGLYIVPIGIFLVTCATATTFAVFAARPEISRKHYHFDDFACDRARLMVFEEFSDLPESQYIDAMSDLLDSPQRTYRSMLAHVHDLGVTADKKYQHLYYSYTAFMAGSIITVASLLALVGLHWAGILTLS